MTEQNLYHVALSSPEISKLTQPLVTIKFLAIQSFKALCPDALHPYFFQIYWNIVGSSVITLCQEAYTTGTIPEDVNRLFLCLIPKLKCYYYYSISTYQSL